MDLKCASQSRISGMVTLAATTLSRALLIGILLSSSAGHLNPVDSLSLYAPAVKLYNKLTSRNDAHLHHQQQQQNQFNQQSAVGAQFLGYNAYPGSQQSSLGSQFSSQSAGQSLGGSSLGSSASNGLAGLVSSDSSAAASSSSGLYENPGSASASASGGSGNSALHYAGPVDGSTFGSQTLNDNHGGQLSGGAGGSSSGSPFGGIGSGLMGNVFSPTNFLQSAGGGLASALTPSAAQGGVLGSITSNMQTLRHTLSNLNQNTTSWVANNWSTLRGWFNRQRERVMHVFQGPFGGSGGGFLSNPFSGK